MPDVEKPRDLWTDAEFIAAFGEKAKKRPWPVYLGKLQRSGWSGRIKTYLIWCPRCRARSSLGFTVASEAGYERRLACSECRRRYDQRLPLRILRGAFLNPHHHPRFLALLFLVALTIALAIRAH